MAKRERFREELLLPVGIRHFLQELVRARRKKLPHGFMGLLNRIEILSPAFERNEVRGVRIRVWGSGSGSILAGGVDESMGACSRSFVGRFLRELVRQFLKPAAERRAEDARSTA